VWRGGEVAGLIDWDMARPERPLFDVAYALEYAAPFREDAECVRWLGYPAPPDRRHRIEVFWVRDGYLEDLRSRIRWTESARL
jgi:aminoglycoside phosphotransferase (APT) family kinase protein